MTILIPPPPTPKFESALLHVREEQASGTSAGTFTSGAWRTRVLNTVKTNQITGASLAANQITLPAGTYIAMARAPAMDCDAHQAKLVDVTTPADLIVGSNAGGTNQAVNPAYETNSWVVGRFTIAAQKVVEFQHRCQTTKATSGLGISGTFAVVEVYAEVMLWKVA